MEVLIAQGIIVKSLKNSKFFREKIVEICFGDFFTKKKSTSDNFYQLPKVISSKFEKLSQEVDQKETCDYEGYK